ncbi:MAG: beta-lactamase family protein [Prolixibacteraceae bacterium]|nr:beta-lactamase family protein [Prolixibacteraceae bacterium]
MKDTTKQFNDETAECLNSRKTSAKASSVEYIHETDLSSNDDVFPGCRTKGLMFFIQHPDSQWQKFIKSLRLPAKAKMATFIIGITFAVIFVGCDTMIEEMDSTVESGWDWENVNPESQDIDSEYLEQMDEYIANNDLSIHSIIIYKNGTIPFEEYYEPFNEINLHNLKSTSKGIISALTGIALEEGFINNLDESIFTYLSGYNVDTTGKSGITIRHLLTMTSGLEWNENNLNSMYTFFVSKRIVKRTLKLDLIEEPGTTFNYNTGLTHLLSAIISEASGMSTLEFAQEYLFDPLEIENIQWDTDKEGYHIGGSELYLTTRAMTKFGVLYLNGGEYDGNQIIPRDWVSESTTTQVEGSSFGSEIQYGYLWWLDIENPLFTYIEDDSRYLAMGARGQRIFIHPELDAVVVITAEQKDESQCDILIRDYIIPAL